MNSTIINQVIILTILMIIGVFLKKIKIITNEISTGLSNILLNVALPCLIINSFNMNYSSKMMKNAYMVFLISFIIHISLIVLTNLAYIKMDKAKKVAYRFGTIFSNSGFVGYPVAQSLYGEIGVFYAAIFSIALNIFIYSYGISLFKEEKDFKASLKGIISAPMIAIIIGLFMFRFSIKLPIAISSTITSIGSITTPLSMFVIGAMLADVDVKKSLLRIDLYYMNLIKLVLAPLLFFYIFNSFNIDPIIVQVSILMTAMPSAVLLGVFSEKFDGDNDSASSCVFTTTIFSMFTIPLIYSVIC